MISNIMTQDGITAVVDGQNYVIPKDHPRYNKLRNAIYAGDENAFLDAYSDKRKLEKVLSSSIMAKHDVEIKNGMVYYNGDPLHMTLTRRILDLHMEHVPVDSLMNFLCNLMENESYNSRFQLYEYLERNHVPITEDGCFLSYKYVQSDFKSCHANLDGSYNDNTPGKTVKMNRADVDDNTNNGCSAGLHVGAFDYVNPDSQTTVVVKVNPRDVVSVPNDCSYQKIRVCEYEVLYQYKAKLVDNYYQSDGEEYNDETYEELDEETCWDCEELVDECVCDVDSDFGEVDYMDFDEILVGQKLAFVYEKQDGSVSDRVIRVESIFDRNIVGYISAIEDYRSFSKKGMSEVTLLS